jgi:hypothetical protein
MARLRVEAAWLIPLVALMTLLSALGPVAVSAATTITYTRNAAELAKIWVNTTEFEILGGAKAPKFTGSSVSAGIIRWDPTDTHFIRRTAVRVSDRRDRNLVSAVLSTGDVKWAISKTPYKGGDKKPSYPDIVNSNIKVCGVGKGGLGWYARLIDLLFLLCTHRAPMTRWCLMYGCAPLER